MGWFHTRRDKTRDYCSLVGMEEEEQNLVLINKMKKDNKKGGTNKGQKGKKEDSNSSNQGKKHRATSSASSVKSLGTFLPSVMRRWGRPKNSTRSKLQVVQKHQSKWMSFHPSLRHTSLWSRPYHLTPYLLSNGTWAMEPPSIWPLTRGSWTNFKSNR